MFVLTLHVLGKILGEPFQFEWIYFHSIELSLYLEIYLHERLFSHSDRPIVVQNIILQ
jgi:hypothetical protein